MSSGLRMPVSNLLFRRASVNTRRDGFPKTSRHRSRLMLPLVSVPVLSLHNTSILPKFWIAERYFTITFF